MWDNREVFGGFKRNDVASKISSTLVRIQENNEKASKMWKEWKHEDATMK